MLWLGVVDWFVWIYFVRLFCFVCVGALVLLSWFRCWLFDLVFCKFVFLFDCFGWFMVLICGLDYVFVWFVLILRCVVCWAAWVFVGLFWWVFVVCLFCILLLFVDLIDLGFRSLCLLWLIVWGFLLWSDCFDILCVDCCLFGWRWTDFGFYCWWLFVVGCWFCGFCLLFWCGFVCWFWFVCLLCLYVGFSGCLILRVIVCVLRLIYFVGVWLLFVVILLDIGDLMDLVFDCWLVCLVLVIRLIWVFWYVLVAGMVCLFMLVFWFVGFAWLVCFVSWVCLRCFVCLLLCWIFVAV